MPTVGNRKNMTDEERRSEQLMEQAHNAFLQTLPSSTVFTEEGVYPDHVTMVMDRRDREESKEEGVKAAENMRDNIREAPRGTVVFSDPPPKEGGKQV